MTSLATGYSFYACLPQKGDPDIEPGDFMSEPEYGGHVHVSDCFTIGRVYWLPKGGMGRWHGLQYV
jgi:hypothetical protein